MGILIFGDGQFSCGIRFRIWAEVMFQMAVLQFSHWELTRTPGPVTTIWPFDGDTLHSFQVNPHSGIVYMP